MTCAVPLAGELDSIDSLQSTCKIFQQIAKDLWLGEKQNELKIFYAGLMAYSAIICDHLNRLRGLGAAAVGGKHLVKWSQHITAALTPTTLKLTISARLRELNQIRDKTQTIKGNSAKVQLIASCLDFGETPEARQASLKSLALLEDDLRTHYPEEPSQWDPDDFAPLLKIREPSYAVSSAAQSIFQALSACKTCPCMPAHNFGARLCLGTHRKPGSQSDMEDDSEVDFSMFLSMQQNWQEAHVHTSQQRAVQFAINDDEQTMAKTKCLKAKSMRVKQLCEPMTRIQKMAAYRLEFEVAGGRLFKLKSERSESLIDKTRDPISLEQFLRHRSGSFTERTRRILAVILSSAVFHLHDTPWLPPTWGASDVLFFRTASSAIPLKPFIQARLSNLTSQLDEPASSNPGREGDADITETDDMDPDDLDPDDLLKHHCPALVTLAVMLLEVYFVAPFDALANKYNIELGSDSDSTGFTRYLDVDAVFKACRNEIPDRSQFYIAVDNCLNPELWQDDEGRCLDNQTMRAKIYHEVVLPLETELSQAYSSISIDDLDAIAPKVDFASWDRPIQEWEIQGKANNASCGPIAAHSHPSTPQPVLGNYNSAAFVENSRYSESQQDSREVGAHVHTSRDGFVRSLARTETEVQSTYSLPSEESHGRWEYTVGILCALPKELLAVRALFDAKHKTPKNQRGDSNSYAVGLMSGHLVVAACLPAGEYGTNAAADSASNMKRSFTNIRFCLLVGIGGGVPSEENDIRLGDVVVSLPTATFPGVIQYDRGKENENNTFELTGALQPPPRFLLSAISSLRSNPDLPPDPLKPYLDDIAACLPPASKLKYIHPGQANDQLFTTTNPSTLHPRPLRLTTHPEIHYGLIASGNRVVKDADFRDSWSRRHGGGILCYEMEAAGVMNTFPCLVIRGVCDYADAHKNKEWQEYAAATAAAYAKLLMGVVVVEGSRGRNRDEDEDDFYRSQRRRTGYDEEAGEGEREMEMERELESRMMRRMMTMDETARSKRQRV